MGAKGGKKLKEEIDYRCKKKKEKKKKTIIYIFLFYFISSGSYYRRWGRLLRFPSQLTRRRCIKKQLFNFNGHYFDIHLAIKPKIFLAQDGYIILLLRKKKGSLFS